MAFRLYIVPVVGTGTPADPRRPKYFADGSISGFGWSAMDYGYEPWMVVGAALSATDEAFILAQPDGMALPVNLDVTLTAGNVATVQTKLEAINIPADWVTTAMTWRQVVRIVLGMMMVMQRYAGIHGVVRIFLGGITLESTMADLPVGARTDLSAAATSMGLSIGNISGSTTIRQTLQLLSGQMVGWMVIIGGVPI